MDEDLADVDSHRTAYIQVFLGRTCHAPLRHPVFLLDDVISDKGLEILGSAPRA
jgi:hypothetical protein